MTEADEASRRRKPLRRTAWTLVVGGVVATILMIGTGLVLLATGTDIGPGRPGKWSAGEVASVHKHLGPGATAEKCALIGPDGEPTYRWLEWADSTRATTDMTVSCEQDTTFLTGTRSSVVSALQSPLIMAPVGAVILGLLLFFPRFTMAWARLSNPRGGPVRKWLGRRR